MTRPRYWKAKGTRKVKCMSCGATRFVYYDAFAAQKFRKTGRDRCYECGSTWLEEYSRDAKKKAKTITTIKNALSDQRDFNPKMKEEPSPSDNEKLFS